MQKRRSGTITRAEKARQLFLDGYNCAQAVAGAFADLLPVEYDALMKMVSSFGGGMGRMREVCGAVSGMLLIAGYLFGYSDPQAKEEKTQHYRLIQQLAEEFRKETGSIICRELLGSAVGKPTSVPEQRTLQYYKKRPCAEIVFLAAKILEDRL